MTKTCSKCGKKKNTNDFPRRGSSRDGLYAQCKTCKQRADNLRNSTPRGKAIQRISGHKHRLRKKYGMTEQDYLEMFRRQNGKCAICSVSHLELNNPLCVDHNHVTGNVRGLLCDHCNNLLGRAKDSIAILDRAKWYLSHYQTKEQDAKQTAKK